MIFFIGRARTYLFKGLVNISSHLEVKFGIDVAHERFIKSQLAGHNIEMADTLVNPYVTLFYKGEQERETLGIFLPFPYGIDTRDVNLPTPSARGPITRTLVFPLVAVVTCSTNSTRIMLCNWKVEAGNGDFCIHRSLPCDA